MITRAHLVKLLHQLKPVHTNPSVQRFSTEFPIWTSTIKTQSTDDFLKYGLYINFRKIGHSLKAYLLNENLLFICLCV